MFHPDARQPARTEPKVVSWIRKTPPGRSAPSTRAIIFVRTGRAAPIALERQVHALREFASTAGVAVVDEVRLDGAGRARVDAALDDIIQRKFERDDFEALLVTEYTRLGRDNVMVSLQRMAVLHLSRITVMTPAARVSQSWTKSQEGGDRAA